MITTILPLIYGSVSGFVLGLIGAGSGLVGIPMLVYILKVPIHDAISISLIATAVMTYCYLIKSLKHKLVRWDYALNISLVGIIFAPIGARVAFFFSQRDLKIVFSILMLLASHLIWRRTRADFLEIVGSRIPKEYNIVCLSLTGAIAGFLSGISGIGGSIIVMPILLLVMNLNMRRAAATTIFTGASFTTFGAISHITLNKNIDWSIASLYIAGGAIGVILGFILALKVDEKKLKRKFAILSGTIGAITLITNLFS